MTAKNKIMIMAGGTGGHIFPGLAVADYMVRQQWDVCWLGTENRMESELIPKYGYRIRYIPITSLRGRHWQSLMTAPFKILKAVWEAVKIIQQEKPTVILGMGGFASGPGGIAAWLTRTPLVVHEQNAVAGMTNRILSHFANCILAGFPKTKHLSNELMVVGNPLRGDFEPEFKIEEIVNNQKHHILIIGGSSGAKVFNDHLPELFSRLTGIEQCVVRHQVGKNEVARVKEKYLSVLPHHQVQVSEFIDDMAEAYHWADLVICRAGALTVSEIAAVGRAAIFIPYPYAVDDHQTLNAKWLEQIGAAKIIPQANLTSGSFHEQLQQLITHPYRISEMGKKARTVAKLDATERVARICMGLAKLRKCEEVLL